MQPHAPYLTFAALCACALVAAPGEARAQSAPTASLTLEARAQALYQQGRERFFAEDFEQARGLFQTSLDTVDSPNTRMYLGRALQRLGRNAEAYLMLDRAARDAATRALTEPRYTPTRDAARTEADALAPSIGWLIIEAPSAPAGINVRVNGHEVQRANVGVEMPLDPGEVTVEARAEGFRDARHALTLSAGSHERVTLELVALPATRPPSGPATPHASAGPVMISAPSSVGLRNAGIAAMAVGGAAIIAGGALRLVAQGRYDTLVEQQQRNAVDTTLADEGDLAQTLSYAFLGAGAGVAVAGAVMLVVGGRSHLVPLTVSVTPGGVRVGGSF
ncbi:MAG: PEGA domain-containing protein [Polyangiales bacterium]